MAAAAAALYFFSSLLLLRLSGVESYSSGAPTSVCFSMTPGHGFDIQITPSPYRVTIASNSDSCYAAGKTLRLQISGAAFEGFLVEARLPSGDPTILLGTFVANASDAKTLDCISISDSITHTNNGLKTTLYFNWIAPTNSLPPQVIFRLSVVRSYNTYWTNVDTTIYRCPTAPTTASNTSTTTQFTSVKPTSSVVPNSTSNLAVATNTTANTYSTSSPSSSSSSSSSSSFVNSTTVRVSTDQVPYNASYTTASAIYPLNSTVARSSPAVTTAGAASTSTTASTSTAALSSTTKTTAYGAYSTSAITATAKSSSDSSAAPPFTSADYRETATTTTNRLTASASSSNRPATTWRPTVPARTTSNALRLPSGVIVVCLALFTRAILSSIRQ